MNTRLDEITTVLVTVACRKQTMKMMTSTKDQIKRRLGERNKSKMGNKQPK